MSALKAPFPYFGGKSKVAQEVWKRLGDPKNYVEPFVGSAAVLLARPIDGQRIETINDANGYVSNFWRAVKDSPEEVANHADFPVSELDLNSRHKALQAEDDLPGHLLADPEFHCPRIAGWWAWGMNLWIGNGWCLKTHNQIPLLGNSGVGFNRNLPKSGMLAAESRYDFILNWINLLSERLRDVRVTCGDWSRIVTPRITSGIGMTGVFLDPPYRKEDTNKSNPIMYGQESVWDEVVEWCYSNGGNEKLRIALCGHEGGFDPPVGWETYAWKRDKGYSKKNLAKERIWFSPACVQDGPLFGR